MNQLKLFQMIGNLIYYSVIGYPVIIMAIKANKWQKEKGKNYKLLVYYGIVFMLMTQSAFLERSMLTYGYLIFGIVPLLLLFSYQKKDYEPDFGWMKYLSKHRVIIVIFIILVIVQWPMNRVIADKLKTSHHQWVQSSLEKNGDYESYNEHKLSTYEGDIREYLMSYDHDALQIQNYSGTQIYFTDEYKDLDVSIIYRLNGSRWELGFIVLSDPLN